MTGVYAVVRCDGDGCQGAATHNTLQGARAVAAATGWAYLPATFEDFCPDHRIGRDDVPARVEVEGQLGLLDGVSP